MLRLATLIVSLMLFTQVGAANATVAPPVPTVAPTPVITNRNDACMVAASELLEVQVAFSEDQITRYSGCIFVDGTWVWPDVRAVTTTFTAFELSALAQARKNLNTEIAIFLSSLNRQASPFVAGGVESMLQSVRRFTESSCSYRTGLSGFNRGSPGEYTVVEGYTNFVIGTVGVATSPWLTMYISWWLSDRWMTRPIAIDNMNPLARQGFDSSMYWDRAPWPFEMTATHIQDRFLRFMIDTGRIPF